jgi:hypothetical protein
MARKDFKWIQDFKKTLKCEENNIAEKKIRIYLEYLSGTQSFKKDVNRFRTKFNIPKDGFKDKIYRKNKKREDVLLYPEINVTRKNFFEELEKITKKYGLPYLCFDVIECYMFYGEFLVKSFGVLIQVEDYRSIFKGPYQYDGEKEGMWEYGIGLNEDFPVAIFLNPYITQRDLIEYIKTNFKKEIEPLLERYKDSNIKISKVRDKNRYKEIRNSFIFGIRDKSKKEIISMVADLFGEILDYTYVSKIIREEERLRK